MAYTIRLERAKFGFPSAETLAKLYTRLVKTFASSKRFCVGDVSLRSNRIELRQIRLREKRPYCGQHAGPCQVNPFRTQKKRSYTYLEADDWIEFHSIVNDVLDRLKLRADVWSKPVAQKGLIWIRKVALGRRVRYDYFDDGTRRQYGLEHNIFNSGTDDQFRTVEGLIHGGK